MNQQETTHERVKRLFEEDMERQGRELADLALRTREAEQRRQEELLSRRSRDLQGDAV